MCYTVGLNTHELSNSSEFVTLMFLIKVEKNSYTVIKLLGAYNLCHCLN